MRWWILFVFFIECLSGCSTPRLAYPVQEKKYQDDTVSVQAALNLAYSAYLKGCVDRSQDAGLKPSLDLCSRRAKDHVRDNIVFILEEQESPAGKATQ